jgi:hypothetical protein
MERRSSASREYGKVAHIALDVGRRRLGVDIRLRRGWTLLGIVVVVAVADIIANSGVNNADMDE